MVRRKKQRFNIKPVFSAFIWGVLLSLGIAPGELLVETTIEHLGPYLQIAAAVLLLAVIYFSYDWIVEGIVRSRKAWRMAGAIGVMAILLAFLAGFLVLIWDKAALLLVASAVGWTYATIK